MADPALVFPRELTPDLREVLGLMMWHTGPIARVLRAGGATIPFKAEAEQAYVLHWLVLLALEHGPGWRRELAGRVQAMRDTRASATASPPGAHP